MTTYVWINEDGFLLEEVYEGIGANLGLKFVGLNDIPPGRGQIFYMSGSRRWVIDMKDMRTQIAVIGLDGPMNKLQVACVMPLLEIDKYYRLEYRSKLIMEIRPDSLQEHVKRGDKVKIARALSAV